MITPDKLFAGSLLGGSELQGSMAPDNMRLMPVAKLCKKCEHMEFLAQPFHIKDTLEELRGQAIICDFCKMRWHVGKDSFSAEVPNILFGLVGSDLLLNHQYPPVISLLACDSDSGKFVRDDEVCL